MSNRNIDSCYVALAEAVIRLAVEDYVRAGKRIMSDGFQRCKNKASAVHEYVIGRRFFMLGCNGLVGVGGKALLNDINSKYGLDEDLINSRIEFLKSKGYCDE